MNYHDERRKSDCFVLRLKSRFAWFKPQKHFRVGLRIGICVQHANCKWKQSVAIAWKTTGSGVRGETLRYQCRRPHTCAALPLLGRNKPCQMQMKPSFWVEHELQQPFWAVKQLFADRWRFACSRVFICGSVRRRQISEPSTV